MLNPLQEKIVKEFREKFVCNNGSETHRCSALHCDYCGRCPDERSDIEAWLTTTLEEVYKAGKKKDLK